MLRNLIFAIITLVITFLIYIYPFALASHLLFATAILSPVTMVMTVTLSIILFVYLRTHMTSAVIGGITHYGMGIGFIGFCVFNLGFLASKFVPDQAFAIGLIGVGIFAILSVMSLIAGRKIQLKHIEFSSPKLSESTNLIFISDVHLGSNPASHLQRICDQIASLDYDGLLIGGDLFDSSAFNHADLAPLKQIGKPIYFVTGNHEYYVKDHGNKLAQLEGYGITTLHDQALSWRGITLIGIADNQPASRQAEKVGDLLSDSAYNLVMVHQPGIWGQVPETADLMLSGHTHNGQIFPFNLLVRLQFKAVYGRYQRGNTHAYVSSGAGTWGPRMRLGTQNEIIHIALQPN